MKYLTHNGNVTTPKNNVDRNIHKFLRQNDRMLIEASSVKEFKESIISHIIFISQENKRGNPRAAHWFSYGSNTKDFGLTCIPTIQFSLIEIKGVAEFNIDKN